MKNILLLLILIPLLSACVPDSVKEKVNEQLSQASTLLADQEFKKAIAHIELHKLRNGSYPQSLSDLQFLSAMDSSMFKFLQYTQLDSGYELNINMNLTFFGSDTTKNEVQLQYPPEFWKGLGCVKSNVKEDW